MGLPLRAILLLTALSLPARADYDTNQAAGVALGQSAFTGSTSDNAAVKTSSIGFLNPWDVHVSTPLGKTFIADLTNHRVLIFNTTTPVHGQGADLVLGHPNFTNNVCNDDGTNTSAGPAANRLCNPISVYVKGSTLAVVDQGNHRVLIWSSIPTANFQAADYVLGQSGFVTNGANQDGISSSTLNVPYSVSGDGEKLFVADGNNHRVLVWNTFPSTSTVNADLILGQPTSTDNLPNNPTASSKTFNSPVYAFSDGTRFYTAELGNHRVMIWNSFPTINAQGADVVVGHSTFSHTVARDDGTGASGGTNASNFNEPYGVFSDGAKLYVSDFSQARILIWNTIPSGNYAAAAVAVGQTSLLAGGAGVSQNLMAGPIRVKVASGALVTPDYGNRRIMFWDTVPAATGANADRALGHFGANAEFFSNVANAGPFANGMNSPIGITAQRGKLVFADYGNSRVLIWNSVPATNGTDADVVLGQPDMRSNRIIIPPSASTLRLPFGAQYDGTRLFVADTDNHRVLIWNTLPTSSAQPADVVLGQPGFVTNTVNNGGAASGLSTPTGVFSDGKRLYVSDANNHRVLIWNEIPSVNNTPADLVMGHSALSHTASNDDGTNTTGPISGAGFNSPNQVYGDGQRIYVVDTANSRVLIWSSAPTGNYQSAAYVAGQPNLGTSGAGAPVNAGNMNQPRGVSSDGRRLYVTDTVNHRVLVWDVIPSTNGSAATRVLGHANLNTGSYEGGPTAQSLNNPYVVYKDGPRLYAGDASHHRGLIWVSTTPAADLVTASLSTMAVPGGTVSQSENKAFLRLDVYTGGSVRTIDGLRVFNDTATAVDPSMRARWYLDDENDGSEPTYNPNATFVDGSETLIESRDFAGSSATFVTDFSVNPTTTTFWVALTPRDLPYLQAAMPSFAVRGQNNYATMQLKTGELSVTVSSRIASPLALAVDSPDTVQISSASSPGFPPQVFLGSTDNLMARLRVGTNQDYAYLRQLRVYRVGTSANGDQSVTVYRDANANGLYEPAADTLVSAVTPFIGNGTATVVMAPLQELSIAHTTFFIVATINSNPTSNNTTFGVAIDSNSIVLDAGSADISTNAIVGTYLSPQTTIYAAIVDVGPALDTSTNAWVNFSTFAFSGNFGQLGVNSIRYVWDQNPAHTWTDSETLWSAGNTTVTASGNGSWYFHAKGYDSSSLPGTDQSLGPFLVDLSLPSISGAFSSISSTGGVLGETQWNGFAAGTTAQLSVQDASSGLAVSSAAVPFAGDGHDFNGPTSGFGVMYSTNAGNTWVDWSTYTATLSGTGEGYIHSMAVFKGRLYAGTFAGGRIYSSGDGQGWSLELSGTGESHMYAFGVFNGRLYAGTRPNGRVYSSADGSAWNLEASGLGSETEVRSFTRFRGKLYAGTGTNGKIFVSTNGANWTEVYDNPGADSIYSLVVYKGRLYAATSNAGVGRVLESSDGLTWANVSNLDSGIESLGVYNGRIYAGTTPSARIHSSSDAVTWVMHAQSASAVTSFAEVNGKFYAGVRNNGRFYGTADGTNWVSLLTNTAGESQIYALAGFNGRLYVGASGVNGQVVRFEPVTTTLGGADGTTASQGLSGTGLQLVTSTHAVVCGGSPCGATNQVVFAAGDLAGNIRTAGPFAVLMDTVTAVAVSTPTYPATSYIAQQPNFNWVGPSTLTIAGMGANPAFLLQVSLNDLAFAPGNIVISISTPAYIASPSLPTADGAYVSTFTLADSTQYYWRVAARSALGAQSPWSQVAGFFTDFSTPTAAAYLHRNSIGSLLGEGQWNDLASGATVQVAVQDILSGLAVSTGAVPAAGDGHDFQGEASGFGVMASTDAGQSWVDWSTYSATAFPGGQVWALASFKGKVYAARGSGIVESSADGVSWGASLTAATESEMLSLGSFNGALYAGTNPNSKLYRTLDGASWTQVMFTGGLGDTDVRSIAEFNGKAYAGTGPNGRIYASTSGVAWTQVFDDPAETEIRAMAVFNGRLYAGTRPNGIIYETTDGVNWRLVLSGTGQTDIRALAVYNGRLFAGTVPSGRVYATSDGSSWGQVFQDAALGEVNGLAVFGGKLYAGGGGGSGTARLHATADGNAWFKVLEDPAQALGLGLTSFNGRLYVGEGSGGARVARVTPLAAALTGADGTTISQTLSGTGFSLVNSTNTAICGGSACGATNQVRFAVMDRVGRTRSAGPFAVLVDTVPPTGQMTSLTPTGASLFATASGSDSLSGISAFNFEASSSPAFAFAVSSSNFISVSTFTFAGLAAGTTYFVRVTVRDAAFVSSTTVALSTSTQGTVFFSSANVAPINITQNSEEALIRFVLQTSTGDVASFTTLRVRLLGTGADADVNLAKVYLDAAPDGIFNPAGDTELGAASFSAGVADITLGSPQGITGTPKTFFVVYRAAGAALIGGTLGARILGSSDVGFAFPFAAIGPFPADSGLAVVQDAASLLTVSRTDLAPATVGPGQTNVAMMRLTAQTDQGTSLVSTITAHLTGSLASNQISAVKVYRDGNSNGTFEAASDWLLTGGSDLFTGGYSTMVFTAPQSSRTVTTVAAQLFLVVDVAGSAPPAANFSVRLDSHPSLGLGTPADTVSFSTIPLASGLSDVVVTNTLTASLDTMTPTILTQGQAYAVLRATLTVDTASAQVNQVKVNRIGVSADADVSSVRVHEDAVADGGPFNPGTDVLLGSAPFSGGVATVDITTATITAGATSVLFVVYAISPTGNPNDTLGAGMTNNTYIRPVSGFTALVGNFPFNTALGTVTATINTLQVGSLDMSTGGLLQGATNVPLLRLSLRADQNVINWNGLSLQRLGPGPDSDVTALGVWRDVNADGSFQPATDSLVSLGSDVFVSSAVNISFPSAQGVATSTQNYFVTVSVDPNAVPGNTIGLRVSTNTSFSINAPNRISTAAPTYPIDAGPSSIQQFPNTIAVTTQSVAPASPANPGTINIAVERLSLRTNVSQAQWTSLRLDRIGTSTDPDVAAVKIYYDINNLGTFNPGQLGQYQLVTATTATFGSQGPAGTVDLAFSAAQTLSLSTKTYFVVIDLSTTATPARTVVVRAVDQTYFTVNAPNTVAPISFTAGAVTVATPPSLMEVVGTSSAPAAAFQGTAAMPVLTLKAWMRQYSAQWYGLTVSRTGSSADADVSQARLFFDSNGNGLLDPLTDAVVATGTFSGGLAAMGFIAAQTVTTSTGTFFLAYDVSPVAGAGGTLGASIGGPGSFILGAPHGTANTGFPIASAQASILATQNGVNVSFQDKAPAALVQGATVQVMMSLTMNTTSSAVLWQSFGLTRTGTAGDADLTAIHVYKDVDADGTVGPSDIEVTSGGDRFASGAATIVLSAPQTIDTNLSRYLIALDVYLFATPGLTAGVSIASAASFGVSAPNFVVNAGFPMSTTMAPLTKKADDLVLAFADLAPAGINQGAETVLARLLARAARDNVTWTQARVVKTGSLADNLVTAFRLYADTNASGVFDGGDVMVGSGPVAGSQATLAFASAQAVTTSTRTYFVTVLLNIGATVGATVGLNVPNAGYMTVLAPDVVSPAGLPFSSGLGSVLDVRTPTMPILTLDGPFTKEFERIHFVWASTVGAGSITLSEYAIGTTPGGTQLLGFTSIPPTQSDYTATALALTSGATYYVSMRTQSSFGFTSPTGTSGPLLLDLTAPSIPATNVSIGGSSILLSWSSSAAGPSGLLGYLVERRSGSSPEWLNAKTGGVSPAASAAALPSGGYSAQAVTAADLVAGTAFAVTPPAGTGFVRVRGVSAAGVLGGASSEIRFQFGALPKDGLSEVSNYPNPFDSRKQNTVVNYVLSANSDVTITIFNVFGGKVRVIDLPAGGQGGQQGSNDVSWDGTDEGGQKVSKGIYLAVIRAGGAKATHKIAVIH